MRTVALVLLCSGCLSAFTGSDDGRTRPSVMPKLSELPGDATKRDAILDQASQTPGPELRKGQTKKEKKVETAAATTAAIIGSIFSSTPNVTIGQLTMFDENEIVHPTAPQAPRSPDAAAPAPIETPAGTLVPWVKLAPARQDDKP
ncbi:MAG: hypothetical protein ACKV2T_17330 [Kofleriaceae bacterium]